MKNFIYSIIGILVCSVFTIGQANANTGAHVPTNPAGSISGSADNNNNMSCDSTCVIPTGQILMKANTTTANQNGGTTINSATCGSSAGSVLPSAPATFLCGVGTPSAVTTNANQNEVIYNWDCTSTNGSVISCDAQQRDASACGPTDGTTVSSTPMQLCSGGGSTAPVLTGSIYNWTCQGNYGPSVSCSANYVPPPPPPPPPPHYCSYASSWVYGPYYNSYLQYNPLGPPKTCVQTGSLGLCSYTVAGGYVMTQHDYIITSTVCS